MNRLENYKIHLDKTLLGGQIFSFDKCSDGYWGVVGNTVIHLTQQDEELYWQTYPEQDNYQLIGEFLRVDVDYNQVIQQISVDQHIEQAIKSYPNLRLLKGDLNQTILSFILSSNSNIAKIRNSTRLLSEEFGDKVNVGKRVFYTFPPVERIANASIESLAQTKIGYRAEYLKRASQQILENNTFELVQKYAEKKKEIEVREALLNLHGVGEKVADCIMSYSLNFDNVTALDVWGKRFCSRFYGFENPKYAEIRSSLQLYFNGYTAWAGQFLFEYVRENWDKLQLDGDK